MAKKAYIGVPVGDKHKVVEYIESTGEQYINTGFYATNNTKVVLDCDITYPSGWTGVLGSYSHNKHFAFLTHDSGFVPYWGTTGYDRSGVKGRTTFIADKNVWTHDNQTTTFPEATFTTGAPMYIFKASLASDPNALMKLYSCQFYENDVLVRDFVPCINGNGEIGLYDRVEKTFYNNAGTGVFIAGAETGEVIQVGVARKIKKGYIGIYDYEPVFADNTWEQIIHACQWNEVPDTWNVKDQKNMTIGGTDYAVNIIGKHHDIFSDGSGTAPLTFQLHDVYGTNYRMNSTNTNSGGYGGSEMHTTHLPAIKALMPAEVQSAIKPVDKLASAGLQSDTIETISCELFLLCEVEIFGERTYSKAGEGSQYAYYANGGSKSRSVDWWNRSPIAFNPESFCGSYAYGYRCALASNTEHGVSFAFCFGMNDESKSHDGKARKIKKIYTGIGGIARPCWSGGELAYYGTATALSEARYSLAATTVGNSAFFFGGKSSASGFGLSTVDSYNSSLTRSTPAQHMGFSASHLAATTVGNYAITGGGLMGGTSYNYSMVAYDASLVRNISVSNLTSGSMALAATTVGDYAIFGGGNTYGEYYNFVDAYNSSLVKHATFSFLTQKRTELAATTVGNYALFGGGHDGSTSAVVDAFTSSLSRSTPTSLSVARHGLAATTVGDYALFVGGYTTSAVTSGSKVADAYNTALARTTPTALNSARGHLAATTVGNYALFGGGHLSGTAYATVDAYDSSLTWSTPTALSTARGYLAATTVGNYALFGGGQGNGASTPYSVVDAYTIA